LRILVIGSGIAGLTTALLADQDGHEVTVLTKTDDPLICNSRYAQGGIVYNAPEDKPDLLYNDILNAGSSMTLPAAARLLAEQGPSILKKVLLDTVKVPFARRNGDFALAGEGAHSLKRILYSGDNTGEVIITALLDYIKKYTSVKFKSRRMVLDLITIPHHSADPVSVYDRNFCLGAYVYNFKKNKVKKYFADKVVLATGGIGQVYKHTTNPECATGDGLALAKRAGARIVNMEYTQFHPTTLAFKEAGNFLISEALRGEGAVILNKNGEDFIAKFDKRGSLAPRDIVSRAIQSELSNKRSDYVLLSLTDMEDSFIEKRFPGIFKKCRQYGIDIRHEPIPVVPAFHFSVGGVLTGLNGRTSIANLYAVGEVACTGVHGANRLASTSLLEGVVFAAQAVNDMHAHPGDLRHREKEIKEWDQPSGREQADPVLLNQEWEVLKTIMWNYVGISRRQLLLSRALIRLNGMQEEIDSLYRESRISKKLSEFRNAVTVSRIIADSALKNKSSIGCHYRVD